MEHGGSPEGPDERRRALDQARRSRGARARPVGWLLIALAALAIPALYVAAPFVAPIFSPVAGGALGGLAGAALMVVVALIVTLGRRMKAREATEVLERDARAPVVYLRPFASDRTPATVSPWTSRRRARLFRSWFARTFEQRLARALGKVGPVVAVGDPTERLPQLGASRLYADDAEWQETVASLTARAAVIVLQVGESEGLGWEIRHVVQLGAPERVVIALPLDTDRRKQERYDAFRRKFGDVFPRPLPEAVGESQFLYFEEDWTPRLYGQRRSPRLEAAAGHSAAPRVMALRGLDKEFKLRLTPLWVRGAAYALAIVVAAVAIYNVGGGSGEDEFDTVAPDVAVEPNASGQPEPAVASRTRIDRCVRSNVSATRTDPGALSFLRNESALRRYWDGLCKKLDERDYLTDDGLVVDSFESVYLICSDQLFANYNALPRASRSPRRWTAEFADRYCTRIAEEGIFASLSDEEEEKIVNEIVAEMKSDGWDPG